MNYGSREITSWAHVRLPYTIVFSESRTLDRANLHLDLASSTSVFSLCIDGHQEIRECQGKAGKSYAATD